jgi:heat shock protein HtpX
VINTDQKAISRQLRANWARTIGGILLLAALAFSALTFVGLHIGPASVIIFVLSVVLPILSWYNSGTLVKTLMKCHAPSPDNPDHMRLVRLVDEIFPTTGLKTKPEVLISPIGMPNAFATGRSPSAAFIAATEGLFLVDLEDNELRAILAHELAHVKTRDVAITSMTSTLGSLFAIILAGGLPWLFRPAFIQPSKGGFNLKGKDSKKGFAAPVAGIGGFIVTVLLFWVVSFVAKFVTLFVSRARENAADALAAQWTGDPCALATALLKITDWMERNQALLQLKILLGGMSGLLFVSLHEGSHRHANGALSRISQWWREIGENHPPVEDRIAVLETYAGQACPTMSEVRSRRRKKISVIGKR